MKLVEKGNVTGRLPPFFVAAFQQALGVSASQLGRWRWDAWHPIAISTITASDAVMVLELAALSLLDALKTTGAPPFRFDLPTTLRAAHQLAAALAHLHSKGIVNANLKAANVLIFPGTDGDKFKIAVFGLAGRLSSRKELLNAMAGTDLRRAPEATETPTLDAAFSTAADVFSFAVLIIEMYGSCLLSAPSPLMREAS